MARTRLLIDERAGVLRAGRFVNGRLADLLVDAPARPQPYGRISEARVDRILPGDDGCFLKDASGHPLFMRGKAPGPPGLAVTVQVKAEAGHGKAARVSTDIAMPGRYAVHLPRGAGVHRSRRLGRGGGDRGALGPAIGALSALPGGWLLRRAAADADAASVQREAEALVAEVPSLYGDRAAAPAADLRLWLADLPELPHAVFCADARAAEILSQWLSARGYRGIEVRSDPGIVDALDEAVGPLWRPSVTVDGGRLHIAATRALTAIDVDTGSSSGERHADALIAQAARQIRLRNLSGALMLDIPDSTARYNGKALIERLKRAVAEDPVPVHVLGMTRLNFAELSRERRRRSLGEILEAQQETPA